MLNDQAPASMAAPTSVADMPRPVLDYPFEAPQPHSITDVAPGVRWLRMQLPFALDHINLWMIEDGDGWAVVDTGICTETNIAGWLAILEATQTKKITRVFVTHMHPDHVGTAGWLTRKFDCRLWMTRLEYLNCRVLVADTGKEAPPEGVAFYHRAGWDEPAIEAYRARFGSFGRRVHALPASYRRIVDGERIRIGAHDWQVLVGRGHSPEHACMYCPGLSLLISGDQVLPRISSNVSVHAIEPDADPMTAWYASLAHIRAVVPDDVLVLPAHNLPFRGLHARLDYLHQGQDRALDRLRRTLAQPRRAVDVFSALFARAIDPRDAGLLSLATGESLACLNHLLANGEAVREADSHGVDWYRLAAT